MALFVRVFIFKVNHLSLDFLQDPKLKKTVRGEPCLPMTVFLPAGMAQGERKTGLAGSLLKISAKFTTFIQLPK
ncbi:hypothetical protein [Moraxella lacunata]|uniref:hypothetical protein n=1 Tax=Moraxella lacunata TaxID=477 RepID=UPI0015F16CD7|nr:hypothetical protein [Moraxella lacunata]